ncbi:unnamed protein product [Acanthoscelides obtectus]|uniref:Uncharacterized protein n=1 Tax=Acanthoscelides obtectus TaxID=200917 RepID=A0A9P0LNE4_ACAOB|nr:unnamed protein product [Acanthoscelides obtectus]CAK1675067.1 hypothetical protein AOBTE_LOCUS29879 [Acanthoscelides obtectus]
MNLFFQTAQCSTWHSSERNRIGKVPPAVFYLHHAASWAHTTVPPCDGRSLKTGYSHGGTVVCAHETAWCNYKAIEDTLLIREYFRARTAITM